MVDQKTVMQDVHIAGNGDVTARGCHSSLLTFLLLTCP